MIKSKFKYGTRDVEMFLGFKVAHGKLSDLGLDILQVVVDPERVIPQIMFNDSLMLKVWFFYLVEAGVETMDSFESALEILDEDPRGLEPFRKAFWDMVVGFQPTPLHPTLRLMWKEAEKRYKNITEKDFTTSTSPSPPEPDSI